MASKKSLPSLCNCNLDKYDSEELFGTTAQKAFVVISMCLFMASIAVVMMYYKIYIQPTQTIREVFFTGFLVGILIFPILRTVTYAICDLNLKLFNKCKTN